MNRKKEKGFTLVEMLVSIFILSLVVIMLSGILLSSFQVQRRTYGTQRAISEINYATEYISRLARMAKSDDEAECVDLEKGTYQAENGDTLRFIDYRDRCVSFFEEDGRIKMVADDGEDALEGYLTSEDMTIEDFTVEAIPGEEEEMHERQPFAVFRFKAKENIANWFETEIQTAVTRRGLDFPR